MPTIYDTAEKFRAEIIAGERRAANELVQAYGSTWRRFYSQLDPLLAQIEAARARGEVVNESWLYRERRLRVLIAQTEGELLRFVDEADLVIRDQQRDAVEAALEHSARLMAESAAEVGVETSFIHLPTSAVEDTVGFLQDGSPLRSLLDPLPAQTMQAVEQAMISGVAGGQNPRVIARHMRQAMGGGLNRSLTIARTETLRAYRESSRRNYLANDDVVMGWKWQASRSQRTCAVCWGMNGTFHETSEIMGTHPNCRCAMVPITDVEQLRRSPIGEVEFARQPESVQLAVLGPAKLDAYKRGKITLGDLIEYRDDPDFGPVRTERSLTSILGPKPPKRRTAVPARAPKPKPKPAPTSVAELRAETERIRRQRQTIKTARQVLEEQQRTGNDIIFGATRRR